MASPDGTATHLPVWFAVIGVSAAAFLGVAAFTLMYRGSLKAAREQ
jgi:hypothetical protein